MLSTVTPTDLAAEIAAAEGAIEAAQQSLDDGALSGWAADELTGLLKSVRRVQARAASVLLHVVREVDSRGSHRDEGLLTTRAWLRARARMSPAEAAGTVRTARALGSEALQGTAAALARAEIDQAHADLIARGALDAPEGAVALIEPEALAVARHADPRTVAQVMRQFAHALDSEAADEAAVRRFEKRGLSLAPTLDGSLAGTLLADEVNGAVIATAVDAAAGLAPDDRRSPAQRRLDGLVDICRHYLGCAGSEQSRGAAGRTQLIVTVDGATLNAAPGETGSPGATLSWLGPISGSTARRLACDAQVSAVALGPDGEVTDTSRQRRFFTPAQRAAMIGRDGDRCPAPFCDRPVAWADGHHLIPWASGGPTTVANGMLPCEAHHLLLHEGGWSAQRLPDGRYRLHHRDGRVLGPEPDRLGHNRPGDGRVLGPEPDRLGHNRPGDGHVLGPEPDRLGHNRRGHKRPNQNPSDGPGQAARPPPRQR